MAGPTPRILLKAQPGTPVVPVSLDGEPITFRVEPLYATDSAGMGLASDPIWQLLTPNVPLDDHNVWDACHQLREGIGLSGAYAEPDFPQRWLVGDDAELALGLDATCGPGRPQSSDFPTSPDPLWFKDATHSQLADALAAMNQPAAGEATRVAHIDTGYDPNHFGVPPSLNFVLQRSFLGGEDPNDASDRSTGPFNNVGHGAGTGGILAGSSIVNGVAIGAAPFVDVVPLRVANHVVLFYNGDVARALRYVRELCADPATWVDVITMSMGGLASNAWADEINALYEAGVFVVTAAGNNFGNLPTKNIVFPARFRRVLAACGAMANGTAYADLGQGKLAGNYGPSSKMDTCLAAYTPNAPWKQIGCPDTVNLDGNGTSCATPQVAAAAAMWLHQHRAALASYTGWRRVEAVRGALFATAHESNREKFGRGELRARDALGRPPAPIDSLRQTERDGAAFPFLRLLFGIGMAPADDPVQQMLELEALQLSQSRPVEQVLPDPDNPDSARLEEIRDALLADPRMSEALRAKLERAPRSTVVPVDKLVDVPDAVQKLHLQNAMEPKLPRPTTRRLRVYAYDPSLGTRLETLGINQAVLDVPWEEDLQPGPTGEYLEIVDVDPPSKSCYAPVDLNDPYLLVRDGLTPSETNPQFQQQMVYAVAMKTIEHFERALGRKALWSPRSLGAGERYVRRLRVYPHAVRAANAFYSPTRKALLLGYFNASPKRAVDTLPGGLVFAALSSDVVAHETTHALLDGLHRHFLEPSNQDVLAFHEAFADIVALFQHFSMPEALRQAIATTRGNLRMSAQLGALAVQLGRAVGKYAGLRNAIGTFDADRRWQPAQPTVDDYTSATEPHARGAVLVAAVFDAFLQIYAARSADLVRLATHGSGILPEGAISVDLAERLASEASKSATHVLNVCIRALDYCPVVDITFGEYLRALITADRDLVPDDRRGYRVAFVSAFRARGIYPAGVRTLSEDSLAWEPPPLPLDIPKSVLDQLNLDWDLLANRREAFSASSSNATRLKAWLLDEQQVSDDQLRSLGLVRRAGARSMGEVPGTLGEIDVRSVRPTRRVGPDGQMMSDVVVEITQTFRPDAPPVRDFRGGCTLLIDLRTKQVRYLVCKRVDNAARLERQATFTRSGGLLLDDSDEPFASLHGLA